ncbi:sensor domain-containing diguanylate cyclase [uncultured Neptuniibacter sp.]|uniref:GGDEF domain-containing protein n=1 Tax=uncultured Neptuniibacter sp. TaxID=502143 RepID=UPI00261EE8A1|nr:sensor domain-containing diguanylate cyclase [uncultured Neptuniibacter sp.]
MNSPSFQEIDELHWTLGLIQNLEVGLVVVDRAGVIKLWNGFMENHSGVLAQKVAGEKLFNKFPELPIRWLQHKLESVFLLRNAAYISWEQRPYLFHFKASRPITGSARFMYQNVTLIPLTSPTGEVDHVGILIYDVTDTAVSQIALQDANGKLQTLSREDRLTGLFNRGYWEECLNQEFERFNRSQLVSSLVMFDIDHFKRVNDTYGHQAGDEVIRVVANTLKEQVRKTDIVGRYGGEEFGAILTGTNGDKALIFAERLRARVESLIVPYGGHKLTFTISIGVSEINYEIDSPTEWLEQADQALYQAKQSGRNWVTLFGDTDSVS